jgi:hypothetical protein
VGLLGVYGCQQTEGVHDVVFCHEVMSEFYGFTQFPVGLAVQLISTDEYSAVFVTGAEYNTISRNSLIRVDFNNIAHFHIPTMYFPSTRFLNKCISLIIRFTISFLPIQIIIGFFQKRETEHKHKRRNIGKQEPNFQHINKLT